MAALQHNYEEEPTILYEKTMINGKPYTLVIYWDWVDSAQASAILENRMQGRNITTAHVKRLREQMMNGDWITLGDPLRFCGTGADRRLIDANHRLTSLASTDKRFRFLHIEGFPAWAYWFMDQINKRTVAQNLSTQGYPSATVLAKCLQAMYHLNAKDILGSYESQADTHNPDQARLAKAHPKLGDAIKQVKVWRNNHGDHIKHTWLRETPVAVTSYIYSAVDPDLSMKFWDIVVEGPQAERYTRGSSPWKLRARLIKRKKDDAETGRHNRSFGRVQDQLAEIHSAWLDFSKKDCPCGRTVQARKHLFNEECYPALYQDLGAKTRQYRPTHLEDKDIWNFGKSDE